MEAVDPTLVKASTGDFDWVNKGISSGLDYASAQAQLQMKQQEQQRLQQQAEQTKQVADFHTATLIGNGIDEINRNTGPVRKARIATFMNQMSALGKPVSPEMQAALGDESNAQTMQTMMAGFQSMSPADKATAAPAIGQFLNSTDPVTGMQQFIDQQSKMQKMGIDQQKSANDTQKVQIAAAAQQTKAQDVGVKDKVAQQNADTNALKVSLKGDTSDFDRVNKIQAKAQKIEIAFQTVNASVAKAADQLKLGTSAGDAAAIDAFTKAMAGRTNAQQFAQFQKAGGLMDQIQNKGYKLASGESFDPQTRAQFAASIDAVLNTSKLAQKNALAPIYSLAKQYTPDALDRGDIMSPDSMQLFGVRAKNAPKETQPSALAQRPSQEQNSILKLVGQGKSFQAMVQGMQQAGKTPITQQEYQEAKTKLGLK